MDAVSREGWGPSEGSRFCSSHFFSGKPIRNSSSSNYVASIFTSAPLSPKIEEANAFKYTEKQEAQVEAANALLFLQGQGQLCKEFDQHHFQEEAISTGSYMNSDHEAEEEDDHMMEEFASGSKNKSKAEKPLKKKFTKSCNYEDSLKALKKENMKLKETLLKISLTEAAFRNDPEKVQFYTGLPNYFVFETLMWLIMPHMKQDKNAKLSKFQQLLLTLMRLRLDLRNQDLAYRFGVTVATVTRTIHRIVNIMFTTLVPTAVFWPSRVELRKKLPLAVKHAYPDCAVIIDCFTVCFENGTSVDLRPQGTVRTAEVSAQPPQSDFGSKLKYVIGVAPQGAVMFVSRGLPGDVSDKMLVESCGLLCKLLPGDIVLADQDFDIKDLVSAHRVELKIINRDLYQTDQSVQSSGDHESHVLLDKTSVCNHVEKVIQMVKKRYSMLTGPVESAFTITDRSSSVATFDKIVQVACALNNLCISAVPLE